MKRSYKYRVYPNKTQQQILENNFSFCRFLYNSALQERRNYYDRYNKGTNYNTQAAQLPQIKELFSDQINTIYSQSLQQVLKRLDRSFKNFFRRVKNGEKPGYPRFKTKSQYKSIVFPQTQLNGLGGIKLLDNKKLRVFGIPGEVKVKWHRPWQGKIKQVVFKKEGNHFYVCLVCNEVPNNPLPKTSKDVGIDLGLTSFITKETGEKTNHPKALAKAQARLAELNRSLALKMRGSINRKKTIRDLNTAYTKVSNIRKDFQHKLALNLIRNYDTIFVEDLDIAGMMEEEQKQEKEKSKFKIRSKKSNIADASWGSFIQHLIDKAESAGKEIVKVDPKGTSKTCSNCGNIKTQEEQTLADRIYQCNHCNLIIDRDVNAAINIKKRGLGKSPAMKA